MTNITSYRWVEPTNFLLIYYGKDEKFRGMDLSVSVAGLEPLKEPSDGLVKKISLINVMPPHGMTSVPVEIRHEVEGMINCLGYQGQFVYPLIIRQ